MKIIPLDTEQELILTPDLVWDGQTGDLAIDTDRGDLQCDAALKTAVSMCLLTDCRADETELPDGEENRGWPGDGFDLEDGEPALGSKLWLLRRRALIEGIELEAGDAARAALQTLIDQGACVRVEVSATRIPERSRLELDIALYGRDGSQIYQARYAVLWEQMDGI